MRHVYPGGPPMLRPLSAAEAVAVALHSFGFEELTSTAGGPPPYGHRSFKQGRLVATKRLTARLGALWGPRAVKENLQILAAAGYVKFSGRGRHAGWTLTEKGWTYAEGVKEMAATPPVRAVAIPKRKRAT